MDVFAKEEVEVAGFELDLDALDALAGDVGSEVLAPQMLCERGTKGTVVQVRLTRATFLGAILEAENSSKLVFEARNLVFESPTALGDRVVVRAVAGSR